VDNCYKYGSEIQNGPSTLPKVAVEFGTSHAAMEDQREIMLGVLGSQVRSMLFSFTVICIPNGIPHKEKDIYIMEIEGHMMKVIIVCLYLTILLHFLQREL